MPHSLSLSRTDPIVIAATGGSGTRLVRDLLLQAGVWMGEDVNKAGDSTACSDYLEATVNPLLRLTGTVNFTPEKLEPEFLTDRQRALHAILADFLLRAARYERWGWKNPRCLFILPLIHRLCPQMRLVHVLRDGRDIAFSGNQNQPRKHFSVLFNERLEDTPPPEAAIRVWDRVNREAADWGEAVLGKRYIRLRYETLCTRPGTALPELYGRLELDTGKAASALEAIEIGSCRPKWPGRDPATVARLEALAAPALARFGYTPARTGGTQP